MFVQRVVLVFLVALVGFGGLAALGEGLEANLTGRTAAVANESAPLSPEVDATGAQQSRPDSTAGAPRLRASAQAAAGSAVRAASRVASKLATRADFAELASLSVRSLDVHAVERLDAKLQKGLEAHNQQNSFGRRIDIEKLLSDPDHALQYGEVGRMRAEVLSEPKHTERILQIVEDFQQQDRFHLGSNKQRLEVVDLQSHLLFEWDAERFLEAMRSDLRASSANLWNKLADSDAPWDFDSIVLGGGPSGQAYVHALSTQQRSGSTLLVDAGFGGGTFGETPRFDMNTTFADGASPNPDRLQTTPLLASPLRLEQVARSFERRNPSRRVAALVDPLRGQLYPSSGAYGEQILAGLYNLNFRGTPMLLETRADDVVFTVKGEATKQVALRRAATDGAKDTDELLVRANTFNVATGSRARTPKPELGQERYLADLAAVREAKATGDDKLLAAALKEATFLPALDILENPKAFVDGVDELIVVGLGNTSSIFFEEAFTGIAAERLPQITLIGDELDPLVPRYRESMTAVMSRFDSAGKTPLRVTGRADKLDVTADGVVATSGAWKGKASKVVWAAGVESRFPLHAMTPDGVSDAQALRSLGPSSGAHLEVSPNHVVGPPSQRAATRGVSDLTKTGSGAADQARYKGRSGFGEDHGVEDYNPGFLQWYGDYLKELADKDIAKDLFPRHTGEN